jgi:hypothetical protein
LRRTYDDAPWLEAVPPGQAHRAPWWVAWLALAAPLVLASLWLADSLSVRKAYLRRRKPEFPPLHMDLLADALSQAQRGAAFFHRIGQRLQRRTARVTDRLDLDATVRATVAEGGMMVKPVYARTRAAPDYLVLIERRGAGDQDFERLRAMVLRLKDLIALEIYSYQTEPSMLEPDGGGRAVPIERLIAAHPDHRLLVLGSGAEFLDPVTRAPLAGPAKLMHWERRALLTPVPLAEWAQEEFALARELTLPVGRATPEGLSSLAELLGLEGIEDDELLNPSGDGMARALPDVLRIRPQRFLYNEAPDDRPIAQIIQDLRNYLDPAAFDWLCATAVYPAVQWDLTLYLGVALPERLGGDARLDPLYREDRIGALTQLPWLREGLMPNWLRRALIEAMTPERATEVREALRRLIEAARSSGDPAHDESVRMRILREAPKDRLTPDELFEDDVLLDFMARGKIEDFELPQQSLLDRLVPKEWRQRFGVPEAVMLGVCGVWAGAAYAMAPRAADGALVTGAWLPLIAIMIGGALAYALTHAGPTYLAMRATAERLAPTGLAFAGSVAIQAFAAPIVLTGLGSAVSAIGDGSQATSPIWAPLSLLLIIAWLSLVPLARWLAERAGVYGAPPKGGWLRRLFGALCELALVTAVTAVALVLIDGRIPAADARAVAKGVLGAAGVALFSLGFLAARYAPEQLPPPRKKTVEARADYWGGLTKAALALAPIAPAIFLAAHLGATHAQLPMIIENGSVIARPGEAEVTTATPDGKFFALGGADGRVRVLGSDAPQRVLTTISRQESSVVSLALRQSPAKRLIIAVATKDGPVRLYDAIDGSLVEDTGVRSAGTPPLVALGDDGGWAIAFEGNDGVANITISGQAPTQLVGGPVTALSALRGASYAFGLLSGDVRLLDASRSSPRQASGSSSTAHGAVRSIESTPDYRHPRIIYQDGFVRELIGEATGSPILRDIGPDQRLALGPAVEWRAASQDAKGQVNPAAANAPDAQTQGRPSLEALQDAQGPVKSHATIARDALMQGRPLSDPCGYALGGSALETSNLADLFAQLQSQSAASAAARETRLIIGCTILANLPNVSDPGERQREIAVAIESFRQAPMSPLTSVLLARAHVMQGQLEFARLNLQQALALSGATTRCPSVVTTQFPPGNRDALASQIYVEIARTRFAYTGALRIGTLAFDSLADLYDRTIDQVDAARPENLRDSEADLRCAIYLNFDNIEARLTLGHIYLRLGAEPSQGPQLDRAPYPKAEQVLQYFTGRRTGFVGGIAEGLYLASLRYTLTQQQALLSKSRGRSTTDRTFLRDGELAVSYASRAFILTQRPLYRRQVCRAQIMFGQTGEQRFCAAFNEGPDRAETLLEEGMYWLRRGQREARTEDRLGSWSRAIQAFNTGAAEMRSGQVVASQSPSLPPTISLGDLLLFGQRYVLACRGISSDDTSRTAPEVKEYFFLSGIPSACGGRPS